MLLPYKQKRYNSNFRVPNTYFEGSKRGSKIAKHGLSIERRNDCPLITLSLTIDEEGFPKRSKVWEGNVDEEKIPLSDGKTTLSLKLVRTEEEAFLLCHSEAKEDSVGTYVPRTNRLDIGGEEISKLHRSLTTIEGCFENMKGDLGLRPNFHHTDTPTIAHVHVTVLAYRTITEYQRYVRKARLIITMQTG